MESKKKIIRTMAFLAAIVFGLGVAVAVFTSVATSRARAQRTEARRLQRVEAIDKARSYLDELAARITAVPVDPTIVGEVQARYYEEVPEGRRFVWGMGREGDFLFGIPREDFARLNTVWDTHEQAIVAEGVFVDRQDFLRQLVQQSAGLDFADLAPDPDDPDETPWSGLRYYGNRDEWMVFSAPLKDENGAALGNLYLKMEDREGWWEPWQDTFAETVLGLSTGVSVASGVFLWFLLPTWVYVDARERGVRRALLWAFLVLISALVGLVVYLIARPERTNLTCPGCEREINGGAYCPHCGHDLSSAFCSTCRYPLKPDWAFCPSCRTEIGRLPAPAIPEATAARPPSTGEESEPENG